MKQWSAMRRSVARRVAVAAAASVTAAGVVAGVPVTADAAPDTGEYTLTLVRHGESEGNTSGFIDTKTPGPNLTAKGRTQARAIAELLGSSRFDGVYASRMIRTQQTAEPMARKLHKRVVVKDGVHEILAGDYEGTSEADAKAEAEQGKGYFGAPFRWMNGDLAARIPGAENGTEFLSRYTGSINEVFAGGKRNPVVFSHVAAISTWVMLSANNAANYAEQSRKDVLKNVGYIVLKGKPGSWRIVKWVGSPQLPAVPECPQFGFGSSSGSLMPC
ncbi:histidine phosphatase family protein [Gordonia shandongensis]|uniref:histidine phosphatase family protein n=1 Tax=Gordonia shandongensis TaxID=376351 RepID=UPI0006858F7E|nr:histidine phosphatase family protein [Gordonia shandongensis]